MRILKTIILLTLIMINVNPLKAQKKANNSERKYVTYITGKIDPNIKSDTLSLIIRGPFYTYGGVAEQGATQILNTTTNKQGEFKFKILTENSPFHISLFLSSNRDTKNEFLKGDGDIDNYLIEAGDSIHVVFDKDKQSFTGPGSNLFDAQYKVEQTDMGCNILTHDVNDEFRTDIGKWLKQKDSLLNNQLELLADFRSKLSPIAYGIVRADIIAVNRAWIYRRINFAGPFFVAGTPLENDLKNLLNELQGRLPYIGQEDQSSLSPKYIHYLYNKMCTEVKYQRIIKNVDVFRDDNYFQAINKQYSGMLRDKLLAYWLLQVTAFNKLQPDDLDSALSVIQVPTFIKMAQDLKEIFTKGYPVTDYDFKDPKGETVHLADFKGKVVIIDFWFSGCGGCIAVAAGMPHVEQAFTNRKDIAFVSISIDKDKKQWLKSIDKNPSKNQYTHYTTPSTTYLYTGGTGRNNPFINKYVPVGSYPSLLIIDREGKIFSSTPPWPTTDQGKKDLINELTLALGEK